MKVAPEEGVAPEQHVMKRCPDQADLKPQPKIPGNGCCCACCGAGPKDIKVEDIKNHGNTSVRWIQKPDGRVIEYYVYGSEDVDARIFIQVNGSMGSAKFFSELPSMVSVLKEKKVKAIAVNIAGHGFTSGDPLRPGLPRSSSKCHMVTFWPASSSKTVRSDLLEPYSLDRITSSPHHRITASPPWRHRLRRMGDWAKSDVAPVLEAEGVPGDTPLIIEGSSFGSAHCNSLMHHFQDRVTHVHFHVPALASEVSKELKLKPISEGGKCTGKYATTCFLCPGYCCSPCLFCCCSGCKPLMPGQADEMKKALPRYNEIKEAHGFEMSDVMKHHSIGHALATGIHGIVYNFFLGQLYKEWGFHPFNDIKVENVEKMKIIVSYGEKDVSSPESHGEYMATYYSEKCNKDGKMFKNVKPEDVIGNDRGGKCLVNHGPGGHMAHFVPFCKGDLLRQLLEL